MKKSNLEGTELVEALKTKIWSMIDILRDENLSSEEFHVILFLLSAYKDGFLEPGVFNINPNLIGSITNKKRDSESQLANQYASISPIFEPVVKRISDLGIRRVINVLNELNRDLLCEYFTQVFESVLFRITKSQGRFGGEFFQPA